MILVVFDVLLNVRNMMEGGVAGGPTLFGIGILMALFIGLLACKVPAMFAFLMIVPAALGLYNAKLIGVAWFWGVIVLILGILLARIILAFISRE